MRLRLAVPILLALIVVVMPGAAAAWQVDPARVPSRILYDLVVPVAHVERFDGSASAPPADAATLRQAAYELTRASLDPPTWSDARAFRDDGGNTVRIGMIKVSYERIRPGADRSGAVRVDGDRLVLDAGALETARAFMAAPTRGYTYRGGEVSFVLDAQQIHHIHLAKDRVEVVCDGDSQRFERLRNERRRPAKRYAGAKFCKRVNV